MIKIPPTKRAPTQHAPIPERRFTPKSFAVLLHAEERPHRRSDFLPSRLATPESRLKPGEQDELPQRSRSVVISEEDPEAGERSSLEDDRLLDPMTRHLANPFGMPVLPQTVEPASGLQERMELARTHTLEQMFPALVRKAAWHLSRDGRSATLRLEIGSGSFDGTTVLIRADLHEVHIELDAPPGIDLEAWKNRLRLRLASQGLIAMIS